MEEPTHQLQHRGALFNGQGLAQGLAADGHTGNQGRNGQGHHHGVEAQGVLELHHDDSGRGAADDAADIAHHVVAEAGDLVGPADQTQRLPGAGDLVGSHGVEGPLVRRRHRHADDIKEDAQQDKPHEHAEGQGQSGPRHSLVGHETQHSRKGHRYEEDLHRPAETALLLLPGLLRLLRFFGGLLPRLLLLFLLTRTYVQGGYLTLSKFVDF